MARSQIHSRGLEDAAIVDIGGSSIASRRRPAVDKDDDGCSFRGGIFTGVGYAKEEIRLWDDGTFDRDGDGDGHGVDKNNNQDGNDVDNNSNNHNNNHKSNNNPDSDRSQRHQPLSAVTTSQHEDAHLSSLLLSAYPSSPLSGNRRRHNRTTPHHSSLPHLDAPPSASPPAAAAMGTSTSCSRSPLQRHRSHPHRPPPPSLFERNHGSPSERSLSPPPFRLRRPSLLSSLRRLVSRNGRQFPLPPRLPRVSFSNKTHWCLAWLFAVAIHAWGWHRPWNGGMDWPAEGMERPTGREAREEKRDSRGMDHRRSHRERDDGTSRVHRSHHGEERGVRRGESATIETALSGNGTAEIRKDGRRDDGDDNDEMERIRERFDGVYSSQRNGISEWSLESSWKASGASGNETVDFRLHGASQHFPRSVSLRGTRNGGSDVRAPELLDWISSRQDSAEEPSEDEADLKSSTVVWDKDRDCVPMADWQDTFHPTCNSIHEMDVSLMLSERSFSLVSSKGFWRNAWKVNVTRTEDYYPMTQSTWPSNREPSVGDRYAVLKSLKYVHDPNDETFELSRVDAVALDVVTQSRFTINIYGYCGTSSLQEFANGDLKGLLPRLEPVEKLRYAAWVAQGVADVHGVGAEKEKIEEPPSGETERVVPFIHNDLNMDNILLGSRDGVEVPLLNDFNIAVFRKKDAATGEPCKFRGRFANPQWMSPEQQERPEDELSTKYLNEKVDIYALGNIFYKIAVGNSPWKNDYKTDKITPELKAKIARAKLRGGKPKVPADVRNTTDPSILAILNAMDWCYRNDPELRPSAREIAYNLKAELEALERNGTADVLWPRLRSRRLI